MKHFVVAALLSVQTSECIKVKDDWLVETPSVGEFLDAQADMSVLGAVKSDMMAAIPKDHQITYTQAKSSMKNKQTKSNSEDVHSYHQVSESE